MRVLQEDILPWTVFSLSLDLCWKTSQTTNITHFINLTPEVSKIFTLHLPHRQYHIHVINSREDVSDDITADTRYRNPQTEVWLLQTTKHYEIGYNWRHTQCEYTSHGPHRRLTYLWKPLITTSMTTDDHRRGIDASLTIALLNLLTNSHTARMTRCDIVNEFTP